MKVNFIKQAGGLMVPANDMESDRLARFKTGEVYEVDIKLSRNASFHGKVFKFFNFCFEHWDADKTVKYQCPTSQFNTFREHLTVLAGFYISTVNLNGEVRIRAESLSYAQMDQERFEFVYQALIQAAIKQLFGRDDDNEVYNKLVGFF